MGLLFKLLASLLSLVTAVWAMVESLRNGLLIASTIFAAVKIIAFVVFISIVIVVIYLLLKGERREPAGAPQ
jgi:hypothetical protein